MTEGLRQVVDRQQQLAESIETAKSQLSDLQLRLTASERLETEPSEQVESAPLDIPATSQQVLDDSANWERLRELWYRNTSRQERVISGIAEGRTRNRYQRRPRRNYATIISELAKDGFISSAVEKASLELNQKFSAAHFRRQPITDESIGNLEVLDRQLESEIGLPPTLDLGS